MKACLMKVNYDPKYMTPHTSTSAHSVQRGPSSSNNHVQSRFTATRQIYNSSGPSGNSFDRKTQDQIHHRAKERLKQASDDLKAANSSSSNNASATSSLSTLKLPPAVTSNNRITSKTHVSNDYFFVYLFKLLIMQTNSALCQHLRQTVERAN